MPVPRHPAGSGGWAAGRPGAGAGGARASRSFRERAPPSSRRCARPRCSPLGRRGGGGRSVPLPCPGARSRCRRAQEAVAVLRGPLVLTRVFPFRFWSPGCKVNGLPQRVVELPRCEAGGTRWQRWDALCGQVAVSVTARVVKAALKKELQNGAFALSGWVLQPLELLCYRPSTKRRKDEALTRRPVTTV